MYRSHSLEMEEWAGVRDTNAGTEAVDGPWGGVKGLDGKEVWR